MTSPASSESERCARCGHDETCLQRRLCDEDPKRTIGPNDVCTGHAGNQCHVFECVCQAFVPPAPKGKGGT